MSLETVDNAAAYSKVDIRYELGSSAQAAFQLTAERRPVFDVGSDRVSRSESRSSGTEPSVARLRLESTVESWSRD